MLYVVLSGIAITTSGFAIWLTSERWYFKAFGALNVVLGTIVLFVGALSVFIH